jgi:hypothetical protein
MSYTLATSGQSIRKAGVNANSTIILNNTAISDWTDQAEALLYVATGKDWVTDYSTVNTNAKPVLADAVSSLVAAQIIAYDISSYIKQIDAQTMLDYHRDNFDRIVKELTKDDTLKKMVN